jgi:GntR family transcriptional regulator, transcriptional repressor for pyruvate dehydrogenase complex
VATESLQTTFSRIRREPRLSDRVAGLLLETIVAHDLQPGDRLPSERELGEQFGVSRTVIREAVRALAAKGLIEARSGSGLRVAAVDASAVSESMSLYLRGGTVEYPKVHEVRRLLEVEIAGLAAERATEAALKRMRKLCEQMEAALGDVERAARLDLAFHRAIATATRNELYLLLLDSIGEALLEIRRNNLQTGAAPETVRAHRQIVDRIAAKDAAGARRAMAEHLDQVEKHWRKASPPVEGAA